MLHAYQKPLSGHSIGVVFGSFAALSITKIMRSLRKPVK